MLIYAAFIYAIVALNRVLGAQILQIKQSQHNFSHNNFSVRSHFAVNVKRMMIATPLAKAQR